MIINMTYDDALKIVKSKKRMSECCRELKVGESKFGCNNCFINIIGMSCTDVEKVAAELQKRSREFKLRKLLK